MHTDAKYDRRGLMQPPPLEVDDRTVTTIDAGKLAAARRRYAKDQARRFIDYGRIAGRLEAGSTPSEIFHLFLKIHQRRTRDRADWYSLILQHAHARTRSGTVLDALEAIVPPEEYQQLAATSKLTVAALAAGMRRIVSTERRMRSIRRQLTSIAFPIYFTIGANAASLYLMSAWVLPTLLPANSSVQLPLIGTVVVAVANSIATIALPAAVFAIAFILFYRIGRSRLTGTLRIYLDRHWPFSMYRAQAAMHYTKILAAYLLNGANAEEALSGIANHGSPYLKWRALSVKRHINRGLVEAHDQHDPHWPDPTILVATAAAPTGYDAAKALDQEADRWLTEFEERITELAPRATALSMLISLALNALMLGGILTVVVASRFSSINFNLPRF